MLNLATLIFNIIQVSPIPEFCSFQICRTEIGNFVKTESHGELGLDQEKLFHYQVFYIWRKDRLTGSFCSLSTILSKLNKPFILLWFMFCLEISMMQLLVWPPVTILKPDFVLSVEDDSSL